MLKRVRVFLAKAILPYGFVIEQDFNPLTITLGKEDYRWLSDNTKDAV